MNSGSMSLNGCPRPPQGNHGGWPRYHCPFHPVPGRAAPCPRSAGLQPALAERPLGAVSSGQFVGSHPPVTAGASAPVGQGQRPGLMPARGNAPGKHNPIRLRAESPAQSSRSNLAAVNSCFLLSPFQPFLSAILSAIALATAEAFAPAPPFPAVRGFERGGQTNYAWRWSFA